MLVKGAGNRLIVNRNTMIEVAQMWVNAQTYPNGGAEVTNVFQNGAHFVIMLVEHEKKK